MLTVASPNGLTWYLSSDQFEEEESVVVHDRRLPLYLNSHRIVEVGESFSVSGQRQVIVLFFCSVPSMHVGSQWLVTYLCSGLLWVASPL